MILPDKFFLLKGKVYDAYISPWKAKSYTIHINTHCTNFDIFSYVKDMLK
jgi:hypothetical protein